MGTTERRDERTGAAAATAPAGGVRGTGGRTDTGPGAGPGPGRGTGTATGTRVLFRAGGFGLARHCCAPGDRHGGREEVVGRPEIVVVRSGAYVLRCARGQATADANQALFLNAWEPYQVSHPLGGDDCFVLRLPEADLLALAGGAAGGDDLARPFPRLSAPPPAAVATALHRLAAAAVAGASDPLAIQEGLVAVASATVLAAVPAPPRRPLRAATVRDHRERAEAVKLVLARRLGERVELASLGREVHASPFHLARLFRAATGTTIHAYLVDLRLREALARLADGERDLAGLAFDLGFADHAHLTRTFRRRFGSTPSAVRRALTAPRAG